jgi:hypothetical protein
MRTQQSLPGSAAGKDIYLRPSQGAAALSEGYNTIDIHRHTITNAFPPRLRSTPYATLWCVHTSTALKGKTSARPTSKALLFILCTIFGIAGHRAGPPSGYLSSAPPKPHW